MTIGERHSLEFVAMIETVNFDDVNGDGIPSDGEMESDDFQSVNYIDGVEITDEECASYDVGEYEYIEGGMNLEELKKKLGQLKKMFSQYRHVVFFKNNLKIP